MKKILICTYNYFTSKYQVGSHNYAKAFAKLGYQVAFVSNPISSLHYVFANNDDLKNRDEIHSKDGIWQDNIWYYVPKSFVTPQNKPILSTKYVFENWYKFSNKNLFEILKKNGFEKVDILWIESPFFSFMLDNYKFDKSILRLADFSKGFEQNWDLIFQKEIEISKNVNKVIYTGKKLKDLYHEIELSKMTYIANGIDLESLKNIDECLPEDLKDLPSPRVIYIGMIDYWFDIDLLYESALTYLTYSFIIIGDIRVDISKLKKLKNVYFLGVKKHKDIGKYLSNCDIGIIPFKKSDFVDAINPIKLYEYAGYGLKIVSSSWREIESLSHLFNICNKKEDFIKSLGSVEVENKEEVKVWLNSQDWKLRVQEAVSFETNI